ncbi:MAG: DUF4382 domain-containing protein [Spirochaetia bacterium]|nr:DUF4382 domain-containing protein [Spirochaetia bacterium]
MKKNIKTLMIIFFVFSVSCSTETTIDDLSIGDLSTNNVSLKMRTSSAQTTAFNKNIFEKFLDIIVGDKLYAYDAGNGVVITDFQMSFRDIKLDKLNATNSEIEFTGPFQIDLLNDTQSLTETIGSGEITAGTYKKVRFVLHKSTDIDTNHVLYDRSIYIAGTINGTNFIMHHDTSENIEIQSDAGIEVNENTTGLLVDINLDNLLSGIDLTTAEDSNNDGLIDISPITNDDNINRDLAESLKDNIKLVADFLEDK